MTDLRAAAQQALNALENAIDAQSNPARREFPTIHDFGQMRRAHTDLRAALAQQEQEQEQEPVAWIYQNANTEHEYLVWNKSKGGRNWRALYTHPPRREWVSLTDEKIVEIVAECAASAHRWDYISVARAIEQALRSKNNG